MDMLELMDKVERGDYAADRFPVRDELLVNGQPYGFTYRLVDAMQHAQTVLSRRVLVPSEGEGIITASCNSKSRVETVTRRVGVGLRIGGEASLCFACGPEGGVYHPTRGQSLRSVLDVARRLAELPSAEEGED